MRNDFLKSASEGVGGAVALRGRNALIWSSWREKPQSEFFYQGLSTLSTAMIAMIHIIRIFRFRLPLSKSYYHDENGPPIQTCSLVALWNPPSYSRREDHLQASYSEWSKPISIIKLTSLSLKICLVRFSAHQFSRQQQLLRKPNAGSLPIFHSLDYGKVDVVRIQTYPIDYNVHNVRNQIF